MAYLNYKTENETSHCLNEFCQDLCLALLLVPSSKVMAKTLLILSEKTRHDAKSTWEERGKASKDGQFARSTQNLISMHSHWIKEELRIYVKWVGRFHSKRKEFILSPTFWVNAPYIALLAIMRTAFSLEKRKAYVTIFFLQCLVLTLFWRRLGTRRHNHLRKVQKTLNYIFTSCSRYPGVTQLLPAGRKHLQSVSCLEARHHHTQCVHISSFRYRPQILLWWT